MNMKNPNIKTCLKFYKRNQQSTIILAAAILIGGFVVFKYLPFQEKLEAIERVKAGQMLVVTKAEVETGQLPILKEQLDKLQLEVKDYYLNIPNKGNIGAFLQKIADLMGEYNLREQLIQPEKQVQTENLNCIPVTMQCKGSLTQIFEFFRSLQSQDRLVRFEQVRFMNDSGYTGDIYLYAKAIIYYGNE